MMIAAESLAFENAWAIVERMDDEKMMTITGLKKPAMNG